MRSFYIVSSEKYPNEPAQGVATRYQAQIANVRYFENEGDILEVSEAEFQAAGFDPKALTYFAFEGQIGLRSQEGGYAVPYLELGLEDRGRPFEDELERMGVPDEYHDGPDTVRARITVELFYD